MKERIKTIMAIIGIILLSLLIIFITIVKYYIRPHKTLPVLKQETIKNIATTVNQIRNIDNLKNIEQNNFLISNIACNIFSMRHIVMKCFQCFFIKVQGDLCYEVFILFHAVR